MEIIKKQNIPAKTDLVVIGYECDICEKQELGKNYPDDWYYFSHQHSGWGNDDIESVKWFLVCSAKCYFKQLRESFDRLEAIPGPIIDGKGGSFIKKILGYVNS